MQQALCKQWCCRQRARCAAGVGDFRLGMESCGRWSYSWLSQCWRRKELPIPVSLHALAATLPLHQQVVAGTNYRLKLRVEAAGQPPKYFQAQVRLGAPGQ